MSEDLSKCRRNLLIACSILIIFSLAGAEINAINAPGIAVTLDHPEIITYFVWMAMIYELVRFNKLYKKSNPDHEEKKFKHIAKSKKIRNHIASHDSEFMMTEKRYPLIKRGIFTREIEYIANVKGITEKRSVKSSLRRTFLLEVSAYLKYAALDSEFIEYDLPNLWALIAIALPISKIYIQYIIGILR